MSFDAHSINQRLKKIEASNHAPSVNEAETTRIVEEFSRKLQGACKSSRKQEAEDKRIQKIIFKKIGKMPEIGQDRFEWFSKYIALYNKHDKSFKKMILVSKTYEAALPQSVEPTKDSIPEMKEPDKINPIPKMQNDTDDFYDLMRLQKMMIQ